MCPETTRMFDVVTDEGRAALEAVIADPSGTLLALDFDGTLAPIIEDPSAAQADSRAVRALGRLGTTLAKVAVVTGRPVTTARRLGAFESQAGLHSLSILGQYGVERWDAETGETHLPPVPPGVAEVKRALPSLLVELDLVDVMVEDKDRALVLHTRGLPDPDEALQRLRPPVAELAERHQLMVEPGKHVLEIRAPGQDKGDALRLLAREVGARQVVFGGDDLGDLPAYDAVVQLRAAGVPGLLLCSASVEQDALVSRADVVLHGTEDVASWLTWLADEIDG